MKQLTLLIILLITNTCIALSSVSPTVQRIRTAVMDNHFSTCRECQKIAAQVEKKGWNNETTQAANMHFQSKHKEWLSSARSKKKKKSKLTTSSKATRVVTHDSGGELPKDIKEYLSSFDLTQDSCVSCAMRLDNFLRTNRKNTMKIFDGRKCPWFCQGMLYPPDSFIFPGVVFQYPYKKGDSLAALERLSAEPNAVGSTFLFAGRDISALSTWLKKNITQDGDTALISLANKDHSLAHMFNAHRRNGIIYLLDHAAGEKSLFTPSLYQKEHMFYVLNTSKLDKTFLWKGASELDQETRFAMQEFHEIRSSEF